MDKDFTAPVVAQITSLKGVTIDLDAQVSIVSLAFWKVLSPEIVPWRISRKGGWMVS